MQPQRIVAIVLCFGLPFVAAAVGGIASANAPEAYSQLQQPAWAPPSWLFGPVWTLLYLMMGAAAYLVWRRAGWNGALIFFFVHLLFNALWSWLFFAWSLGMWSVADIVVLWLMIAALIAMFGKIDRRAAALLVPYLLWVTYATALNVTLWQRNAETLV